MVYRTLAFTLLFLCLCGSLLAETTKVKEIRVQGLVRVEKESIRRAVVSRPGQPYSIKKIQEDIRSIYELGFFTDVQVDVHPTPEGPIITYMVEERPSVLAVKLSGNDEVDEDDINEVIDIKPFSVLSYDKIYRNIEKIRNVYIEKGFFLADVEHEVTPAENNQVVITFIIKERAKVEVKKIILMGNEKIPEKELLAQMLTKPGDILSFLTNSGQYRQEMVERDAYMIEKYYADHGYINVNVATPIVTLSADRTWIYVTIKITEGEQHFMGELDFGGDRIFPKERLRKLVTLEKGDVFNRSRFLSDMERVAAIHKNLGFAYTNVTPITKAHDDTKQIDVTMNVKIGSKVWIERIDIVGNTKTRDKVIRREMRIAEGDQYSITGINRSKRKIYQLGYFETVEITESPGSSDERIVLTVEIKEKRTGTLQLGVGFSSLDSFVFQAQIAQNNLFGRGQSLQLSAQISASNRQFMLRFTEPYFLDSRVNFSFSIFNQSYTYPNQGEFGSYSRSSSGGDLTLGYPILDDVSLFLMYTIKDVNLNVDDQVHLHLFKSGLTSSLTFIAQYDTRDNRLFPSDGMLHQLSVEYADSYTGSEIEFLKFTGIAKFFFPLYKYIDMWDFFKPVFKINAEIGYVMSLEEPNGDDRGNQDFPGVPIAERYLLGGIYTIRGYEFGSISPTIDVIAQDDPAGYPVKYLIGGNKEFFVNFELEFPLIEAAGIRWVFFFDMGNTWAEDQQFFYLGQSDQDPYNMPLGLYMSYGFGIRWYSPIGPLRFEWGLPVKKRPEDDTITFEFSIGNQF